MVHPVYRKRLVAMTGHAFWAAQFDSARHTEPQTTVETWCRKRYQLCGNNEFFAKLATPGIRMAVAVLPNF
jgi:hypothetical protein